jgi:hypothetical protein
MSLDILDESSLSGFLFVILDVRVALMAYCDPVSAVIQKLPKSSLDMVDVLCSVHAGRRSGFRRHFAMNMLGKENLAHRIVNPQFSHAFLGCAA